jgi:hypothetical protein
MKKLAMAFAIILGLNMIGSIISLSVPVSYADDEPQQPAPTPPKPDSD